MARRKANTNHIWIGNEKQELVDAINKVLFTQFKKDAKEAHKLVESYGFEIDKLDGFFRVYNPDTCKGICLEGGWKGVRLRYGRKLSDEEWNNHKLNFDLINFLYTPVNHDWYYVSRYRDDWCYPPRPTLAKFYGLQEAKKGFKKKERQIEELKKEMAEIQDKIIELVQDKKDIERRIDEHREELGLKKGA